MRMAAQNIALRQYLKDIQNAQHCKALTRLLSGDHPLAVVHLTWTDNHRIQVPHDERVCRFCKQAVETPEHALLECTHQPLVDLRSSFLQEFYRLQPRPVVLNNNMDKRSYLAYLASSQPSFSVLAKWVYSMIKVYNGTVMYVPEQYRR